MRQLLSWTTLIAALAGCAGDGARPADPAYAYRDWPYHPYGWYDDPFWIWVDDNPDCCETGEDLKNALEEWWSGLDAEQQQAVREGADAWLADHGLESAEGQSRRELILATASERWDALSPEERQSWLAGRQERAEQRQALASRLTPEQQAEVRARVASMTPEQRAAARARLDDSPGSAGARDRIGDASAGLGSARDTSRFDDHMVSHPTPRRAIGSSPRFRTAGSRGGRR